MAEKKKRKIRKSVLALIVVAAMAFGVLGAYLLCKQFDQSGEQPVATASQEPTQEPTPEATPEVKNASLFMVGDALLHDVIPYTCRQADGSYDFTQELHRIGAIAQPYDLKYWNQETILGGDELGIHGYPQFNGPQAWGDAMVNYGFNMVSLANNHSLDMGTVGVTNSLNYWDSQTSVVKSGVYRSQEEREAIDVHEVNGITYAFFSWTYGMNGLQAPEDQPYMVACYDGHEQEMLSQIEEAKKKVDVVIVAMHWGTEYVTDATPEQQRLAQEVADAGADIIIGNHPHTIGPVQWLNHGKTICFYALGNLCAAQYENSCVEMMAALNIKKTTFNGESTIEITDVKTDLMYQHYIEASIWYDFEIVPFNEMVDDTYVVNHQAVYDEYKAIVQALDPSIYVGTLN